MAQRSFDSRNTCEAASMSEVVVSFLLSPLSLYSWMASTLLRFLIFLPAFVLGALHHSVLLLLAGPWCVATICTSFLLTCLRVGLYLLHVALVQCRTCNPESSKTLIKGVNRERNYMWWRP
ncbi:hypothetical protein GOODEAATRI_014111 [Goodea atripinnis]|uniref:Uncharacterized protein n=1 Tax=Goodea atripinnis TaxID=208336 RepID=A0ABV0NAH7_9TELE